MFFTVPFDVSAAFIEGQKTFHAMAEVGKWHIKNECDENCFRPTQLGVTENSCVPTEVSAQNKELKEVADEEL